MRAEEVAGTGLVFVICHSSAFSPALCSGSFFSLVSQPKPSSFTSSLWLCWVPPPGHILSQLSIAVCHGNIYAPSTCPSHPLWELLLFWKLTFIKTLYSFLFWGKSKWCPQRTKCQLFSLLLLLTPEVLPSNATNYIKSLWTGGPGCPSPLVSEFIFIKQMSA